MPEWGFRLRHVSNNGIGGYDQVHWLDRCIGRTIAADDSKVEVYDGATIAIDWHLSVLKTWFDPTSTNCIDHPNVKANTRLNDQPLTLEKCIDIFTQEENISEAYCSKCKVSAWEDYSHTSNGSNDFQ